MRSTLKSFAASEAERFIAVVVLPTPPFWFVTAITLAKFSYAITSRDVSRETGIGMIVLAAAGAVLQSKATFGANLNTTCSKSSQLTARDTTQSYTSVTSSARRGTTVTFGRARVASLRNTALRLCDSIRAMWQSGRTTPIAKPGNPAPEPKSAILSGPSGSFDARNSDSA